VDANNTNQTAFEKQTVNPTAPNSDILADFVVTVFSIQYT